MSDITAPALDTSHDEYTPTLIEWALDYARNGVPVIPVNWVNPDGSCSCREGASCAKPGKHPIPKGWPDLATTDPATITEWWTRWPKANIGTNGFDVLDLDGPAGAAWLAEMEALHDPIKAPRAITQSGGTHLFFAPVEEFPRQGASRIAPGVDTRRHHDGQVLLYPSVGVKGQYRWAEGSFLPPLLPGTMAPAPDWLIAMAREASPGKGKIDLSAPIPKGLRSDTLIALAGALRHYGADGDLIEATLDGVNRRLGDPPLGDAEVAGIAKSSTRWQPEDDYLDRDAPAVADEMTNDTGRQSLGSLTVADLDHGAPPPQLADPFISPTGITVLYGKGGTGKGITAAHLITLLLGEGHRPYILDYEGHPEEWGYRLHGLGLPDEDKRRVAYRWPYGPDWTAHRGPLIEVADLVRKDAEEFGATVIVIDSYTVATSTGDTMGGAAAAQEFATACALIGLPVLVLAHVRGDGQKFPEKPFGSVFVHNLARLTWAVEALDASEADPDNPFAPKIVRLEFRNMKRNRGGKFPPQFLTFGFFPDHTITVEAEKPVKPKLADLIDAVLDTPMAIPDIVKAITEDTGEKPHPEAVRNALKDNPKRFAEDTGKRPRKWSRR